jgi:hypothetical protein
LLKEARPAPPLPPRFQELVWRRLERAESLAEAPSRLAWLDRLVGRLLQPRLAVATLAVLLLAGGLMGVRSGAAAARQTAQARYLAAVAPNPVR